MWNPFQFTRDPVEVEQAFGDEDESDQEELDTPQVKVVTEAERSYEYSEHEAVAGFTDGTERQFTFDSIKETSTAYVLKNYDTFRFSRGNLQPAKVRKVATLVKSNLTFLHTTNRIERVETREYRNEQRVDLPTAIRRVRRSPDKYSFDEDQVPDELLEKWRDRLDE